MKTFIRFLRDEKGASSIEYGLLAFCIAIGIIFAVQGISSSTNDTFTTVENGFQ